MNQTSAGTLGSLSTYLKKQDEKHVLQTKFSSHNILIILTLEQQEGGCDIFIFLCTYDSIEGPVGVKRELGLACFCPGKRDLDHWESGTETCL